MDPQLGRARAPLAVVKLLLAASVAGATPPPPPESVGDPNLPWLDNAWYKVHLNVRARIELADIDGFEASQAYTIRTRAGLEAKPYYGFSALAELENNWSLADRQYFDGASNPNGKSVIADPENTELNRAYLQYATDAVFETRVSAKAKGGRQRIVLDDARFIGNVAWRQNEQTYDAARGLTNLSFEDLEVQYAYVWNVQRVFGDKGPTPATRDYSSDSHLANARYDGIEGHVFTVFTYLLDFENDSPTNSSNSYGARAAGHFPLDDDWVLGYSGSYAFQTDAAKNPLDYKAHYLWAHLDLRYSGLGLLGVTYEMLGSDDGDAVFVTPLATAHKFNGFDDAFLDNGGPRGLQDVLVTLEPDLPWKLEGKLIYHEFFRADGGAHLGRELDGVVSRKLNDYLSALFKFAWFDAPSRGPADRWRVTFQATFEY